MYPVREGETIEDIISKRKVTMDEFKALNPSMSDGDIKKPKGMIEQVNTTAAR